MKKLKAIIVAALLLLCSVFFVACGGETLTMDEIVGTYKMTEYLATEGNYEYTKDVMSQKELEVYLVIRSRKHAYFAYKSHSEKARAYDVDLICEGLEDGNTFNEISYYNVEQKANCRLLVQKDGLKEEDVPVHMLPVQIKDGYKRKWEKVSGATDLSYVKTQLGEDMREPR